MKTLMKMPVARREHDQDLDGGVDLHRPALGFLCADGGLAVEDVVNAFPFQGIHQLLAANIAVDVASVAAGGDLGDERLGVADPPGILGGGDGVDHPGALVLGDEVVAEQLHGLCEGGFGRGGKWGEESRVGGNSGSRGGRSLRQPQALRRG